MTIMSPRIDICIYWLFLTSVYALYFGRLSHIKTSHYTLFNSLNKARSLRSQSIERSCIRLLKIILTKILPHLGSADPLPLYMLVATSSLGHRNLNSLHYIRRFYLHNGLGDRKVFFAIGSFVAILTRQFVHRLIIASNVKKQFPD